MAGPGAIAASEELVTLCQAQVGLLAQAAGAAWCAVYLAAPETEARSPQLVPIAVYPEDGEPAWLGTTMAALPGRLSLPREPTARPGTAPEGALVPFAFEQPENQQFVLPLLHEDTALGLLIARRSDRPWSSHELALAERVARTLALASWLDRQRQWYRRRLAAREQLLVQQRDRLGDLLHQLRNPMTALRTFSKLLLKRLQPEDRNRAVAESIVGESDRLQDLLCQFEAYRAPWEFEPSCLPAAPSLPLLPAALSVTPLAIAAVLEPLIRTAAAIAQDRQLHFESQVAPDLPPVWGEARALREVLSNLLDNALKYTPPGGWVQVVTGLQQEAAGQMWQGVAIRDTGLGVPPADQERLFERHYRGVQADGEIEGTGLGLAIARELVERLGGRIELVSPWPPALGSPQTEAAGPGSQFVVWLPVATTGSR